MIILLLSVYPILNFMIRKDTDMNKKHLTLDDRATIKAMLDSRASFKEIARTLQVHCTTISKEVRTRLIFKKSGCFGHAFNDCKHRFNCTLSKLCTLPSCRYKKCKNCALCYKSCSFYEKESCDRLLKPPYVCNGCEKKNQCTLEKRLYSASVSHAEYRTILKESRSGISISEEEALSLDTFLSPLLYKGHSPHHICLVNKDEIMLSERTLYHYIDV